MRRQNVLSKLSALSNSSPIDFRNAAYWTISSFTFIADLPSRSRPLAEAPPGPLWRKHGSYRLSGARDDRRSLSSISLQPGAGWRRHAVTSAAHSAGERHLGAAVDH